MVKPKKVRKRSIREPPQPAEQGEEGGGGSGRGKKQPGKRRRGKGGNNGDNGNGDWDDGPVGHADMGTPLLQGHGFVVSDAGHEYGNRRGSFEFSSRGLAAHETHWHSVLHEDRAVQVAMLGSVSGRRVERAGAARMVARRQRLRLRRQQKRGHQQWGMLQR